MAKRAKKFSDVRSEPKHRPQNIPPLSCAPRTRGSRRAALLSRTGLVSAAAALLLAPGAPALAGGTMTAAQLRVLNALNAAQTTTQLPVFNGLTSGNATISQSGSQLTVTQTTNSASLNWSSFDIGSQAGVTFDQPGAGSIALNRILSSDGSLILGRLTANGQVILINPNGIVFGDGAQVNVGGLIASTLNISDTDFQNGTLAFQRGTATGSVTNAGSIVAAPGGYVALLAPHIANTGLIQANLGTVALASGDAVTLTLAGSGSLGVKVNPATVQSLIEAGGVIQAGGGKVLLTAQAANTLMGGAINATGVIEANSLTSQGGAIVLDGSGAVTLAGAKLDASGATGGGTIETSGGTLDIAGATVNAGSTNGKAGTWRIDPWDLTVDAAAASTINNSLATTNVTLQTTAAGATGPGNTNPSGIGDINVNSALAWSANTTLTLDAYHGVNVNAPITASGNSAGLNVVYNDGGTGGNLLTGAGASITLAGSNPSLTINGSTYTLITTASQLQNSINANLAGNYALDGNIDLTGFGNFTPIGYVATNTNNSPNAFAGTFEGLGHSITSLSVNNLTGSNLGFYSDIGSGGTVRNLGLANASVNAGTNGTGYGILAGSSDGTISNVYASGTISAGSGIEYMGGLVGINSGTITSSYTSGSVLDPSGSLHFLGGLAGINFGPITGSHSSDTVSAGTQSYNLGGLVGGNYYATIANSYASGAVIGGDGGGNFGGFAGANESGTMVSVYSTGNVTGGSGAISVGGLLGSQNGTLISGYSTASVSAGQGSVEVGGLAGNSLGGNTTDSYATGVVIAGSGSSDIGGLIGATDFSSTISNSYASGPVTAGDSSLNIGGLVGVVGGFSPVTVSNSYAIGSVSVGLFSSNIGGLVGLLSSGSVTDSYASGNVNNGAAGANLGGLVGNNAGTISGSYWDWQTTGQSTGVSAGSTKGATGLTTAQAMQQSSYVGWDFAGTWYMVNGYTRPFLQSEYSTTIVNAHQLELVGMNATTLAANYTLGADIDMSELNNPSGMWNTATGFVPIGFIATGNSIGLARFGGVFDGAGHTISNLTINSNLDVQVTPFAEGLFAAIGNGGQVRNVGLVGGGMTGNGLVGMLAGENYGIIDNTYGTGSVTGGIGSQYVGGLVGSNNGSILSSYATGTVTAGESSMSIGGLVGANNGTGVISGSYASGSVMGGSFAFGVGGLAGQNYGAITGDNATGAVNVASGSLGQAIGGLVGLNSSGTITNSYATGSVTGGTGTFSLGGLVGFNAQGAVISSYATGSVSGYGAVGGLVGDNGQFAGQGTIAQSYATGSVTGAGAGGLVGTNDGSIINSQASGNVTAIGNNGIAVLGGGLVAYNSASGTISNSSAFGSVTVAYEGNVPAGGFGAVAGGGLIGWNDGGTVSKSTASGAVTVGAIGAVGAGGNFTLAAGGLVGYNTGSVSQSGTTSGVTEYVDASLADGGAAPTEAYGFVGGLVGYNGTNGSVSLSAANGGILVLATVSASGNYVAANYVGGFVGLNAGSISQSSTTDGIGNDVGPNLGAFAGANSGTLTEVSP